MKVRNFLDAYATKRNMLFSTIYHKDKEKGKYPGAYVFPPIKGIENKRPVTGLDFVSLYPSLIMAYSLSPEKLILSCEEADNVREKEINFMKLNFYLTVVFLMSGLFVMAIIPKKRIISYCSRGSV